MDIFALLLNTKNENSENSYVSTLENFKSTINHIVQNITSNELHLINEGKYVFHCYKTEENCACLVSNRPHKIAFSLIKYLVHNTYNFKTVQNLNNINVDMDELQIIIHSSNTIKHTINSKHTFCIII